MRLKAKLDENHTEVVKQLRQIGCLVLSLAAVGKGCPDLLVARDGRLLLLEVKREIKKGKVFPSKSKLNQEQEDFAKLWKGYVATVRSPEEAVKVALGISV